MVKWPSRGSWMGDSNGRSKVVSRLDGFAYEGYRVSVQLVREGHREGEPRLMRSAKDLYDFLGGIQGADRELFYCVHLDVRNQVVGCEEVSRGTLTSSQVHPREVYKAAILSSAASIIVAHNHPSGDPTPSVDDRALTERIRQAGELLGMPMLDHVIIGYGRGYSLAEDRAFRA